MKQKIIIYNLRDHKKSYPVKPFYCDRRSSLGNPFPMMNKSQTERDRVCNLYEDNWEHLMLQEKARTYMLELIKQAQHRPIGLLCWCAPKRCHCETIKRKIEEAIA